jgi:hypothetical protein
VSPAPCCVVGRAGCACSLSSSIYAMCPIRLYDFFRPLLLFTFPPITQFFPQCLTNRQDSMATPVNFGGGAQARARGFWA